MIANNFGLTEKDIASTLGDQRWRLNNLYWITDKDGRKVKFKMNWAQSDFYDLLHTNNVILKCRQLGFSTLINLVQLDTALFVGNTACGVIAHNDDAAKELFHRNIKSPYDDLPDQIKSMAPATADSAHQFRFGNGSSIRVATSMRSGTLQFLHVSEFGKICAVFPQRAREIVTGSLETVGTGNIVVIESTAEGNDGYFYDYTQSARALVDAGKKLGAHDYKFFFYPWWKEPTYRSDDPVLISAPLAEYFAKIEFEIGRRLTEQQKYWYAAKRGRLGEDCYREYPSTPDEAFLVSLGGTYYTKQIAEARQAGRIGHYPMDRRLPVNTFWDIGLSDYTAIWFHQLHGQQHRFSLYEEESGEDLQYYANRVLALKERGFVLGDHYMPWDADLRDKKDRLSYADLAESLGLRPVKIVHTRDLLAGIQQTRSMLSTACFDEVGCELGLKRLSTYRKDWNERTQAYMDRPLHDEASHGADAIRMWAQGYEPPFMSKAGKDRQRKTVSAKCV